MAWVRHYFQKNTKDSYAVHLLPIGGFCAMGEDDEETESLETSIKNLYGQEFQSLQQGPIFNFIMAFVLAVILTAMVGYDNQLSRV